MSMRTRTWLRRITAASMTVMLLAIVAVAVHRLRETRAPVIGLVPDSGQGSQDGDAVGVYKGFEYVESIAGKIVFELTSSRTLGFASGWHDIEGVRLGLYNEGEKGGVLTCDLASFNRQTRDARLSGTVHLAFPAGGFLNSERGRFDATARRLTTESEVVFSGDGLIGSAGRAIYVLTGDRVALDGGVSVRTDGGDSLHAQRLVYYRGEERVVMPDGCRLKFGSYEVDAPRAVIELAGRDGPPNLVELSGGVRFKGEDINGEGAVSGWAQRIAAERDRSGNWQLRAATTGRWITFAISNGPTFFSRELQSWTLRGVLAPDGLLNLQAENGVCMWDVPVEGAERYAEAESAKVWFESGSATDMELEKDVMLAGEGLIARGYRARLAGASGIVMLHGDPGGLQRTVLVSSRGRVSCDQAQLFEEEGRTEARGNVQGELMDVALLGTEEGASPDTLHFAAGVLDVSDSGQTFNLRENARVWQGHRLLLADAVEYGMGEESLKAVGHVRTTLPSSQVDPLEEAGHDVVVVARSLDYSREGRTALYRGSVTYTDRQHILSASEVSINFDEHDRIASLEAIGAVELVDLESARRMTAQKALRDVASRTIFLTGSPVKLSDERGTVVQASSLTWDQASGTVSVAGDTETIYYPEEQP